MSRPFGGALARTRQQQQQARLVIGGAAAATAAAASPQGDDGILGRNNGGGAPQDSSTQGSGAAASASANADAAPQLALEAALPRPEAVEGEVGAMEGRIVKRMEAQVAALRSELLMALWEKEDAARQQPAAAAAEVAALRSELQSVAQRQKEVEGRVAAAAAAAVSAASRATLAAVDKTGLQPTDGEPAWLGRLWWFVKNAVVTTCVAVYATLFLGIAIRFFAICVNPAMAMADKVEPLSAGGSIILFMGVLGMIFDFLFKAR